MESFITPNNIHTWLVTLPDGSHYIMFSLCDRPPYRTQHLSVDDNLRDSWETDDCIMILPVGNSSLPHYLVNHCWDDAPVKMSSAFFPTDTSAVTCNMSRSFSRCWRYNFTKSLLACSNCIGSSCRKLKIYKEASAPAINI